MITVGTVYAFGPAGGNTSDVAFNTAYIYDRSGALLGVHNKNQLYDPEEDLGISPGADGFPVFETDVGRIGIMTCYESW